MKRALVVLVALSGCGFVREVGTDAGRGDCARIVLPTTRNTTYGAASVVKSADLDDIQDCIVGSKWPSRWDWRPIGVAPSEANVIHSEGGVFKGSVVNNGGGAATVDGIVLGPYPEGTRITALGAHAFGTGGGETLHVILTVSTDAGAVVLGDLAIVNPPAGVAQYTLNPLTTIHTMAAGEVLVAKITMPTGGDTVRSIGLQTDRL